MCVGCGRGCLGASLHFSQMTEAFLHFRQSAEGNPTERKPGSKRWGWLPARKKEQKYCNNDIKRNLF